MGINELNIYRGARSKNWRPKSSRNEVNLFGNIFQTSRNTVLWKVESHRNQFLYYKSLLKSIFKQAIITSKGAHFLIFLIIFFNISIFSAEAICHRFECMKVSCIWFYYSLNICIFLLRYIFRHLFLTMYKGYS